MSVSCFIFELLFFSLTACINCFGLFAHRENPSGYMGVSTLSPSWVGPPAPPDMWMSLAEYLDLCKAAQMRPLVGVNYNCHNHQKCNESTSDAVARAVRQVKFVVDAGFRGSFWYIGNEDGAPQHPDMIAQVAHAMKAVDPTLKAFWNDNDLNPASLKAFLAAAGSVMDGAEFHGKWPYGGTPKLPPFTYQQWLNEVPLVEHKSGQTWRDKIAGLRAAAVEAGRADLLLANNEWVHAFARLFVYKNVRCGVCCVVLRCVVSCRVVRCRVVLYL